MSSGNSWSLENWEYFDEQLSSGFTFRMSTKQSDEIVDTAQEKGLRMLMTEAARDYGTRIDEGRHALLAGTYSVDAP